MRPWMAIAGFLALTGSTLVAARDTGFLNRTLTLDGQSHRYVVYVPAAKPSGRPPIILALHGAGERGADGLAQTDVGLGHAIRTHPERYAAIVVFPQAAAETSWLDNRRLALATLSTAQREFHADPARVYAAGLSMGGNGTWALAHDDPKRFAAIVVVCGFAGPFHDFKGIVPDGRPSAYAALARSIALLPVWIVHGDADRVVPVADSRQMAAELAAAGDEVVYKELPGVGHNSWDTAFADPEMPIWLFKHSLRR